MRGKIRLFFTVIFSSICWILAAQPDWSVNPSDYQYTMVTIGVGVIQCIESNDENDIVAAFINNEVRGVQSFDTDVGGRKYAYLIIYDNEFSGNEITFKLYDASENAIIDVLDSVEFLENGKIGDVDTPFEYRSDYGLTELFLTSDTISANMVSGMTVAGILAVNENQDTIAISIDFVNDSLGMDNGYFSIFNDSLMLEEDVDAALKDHYQIHLTGMVNGCSIDAAFILNVIGGDITSNTLVAGGDSKEITIYPNPARNTVYFYTDHQVNLVSIYDLNGRLRHQRKMLPDNHAIDVSKLGKECYTIVFHGENMNRIKRLIVH